MKLKKSKTQQISNNIQNLEEEEGVKMAISNAGSAGKGKEVDSKSEKKQDSRE